MPLAAAVLRAHFPVFPKAGREKGHQAGTTDTKRRRQGRVASMMTPSTRRQDTQVAAAAPRRPAPSLDAFTCVSKSQGPPKRPSSKALATLTDANSDGKRKAACPEPVKDLVSFPLGVDDQSDGAPPSKRACLRLEVQLRSSGQAKLQPKSRHAVKTIPSRVETGLGRSQSTLIAESRPQSSAAPAKIGPIVSANKSSKPAGDLSDELPPHLADLVRLHRAFLRTVVVQIAHMGDNVPMDIRAMTPHISRTWGKRQVTVDDIRRCIAIESYSPAESATTPSPFVVSDYGRDKVCIELAAGRQGASIDEHGLERQFRENLGAICAQRTADEMKDVGASLEQLSMADLPQTAVTDKSAGAKGSVVMVKGHRALAHVKGGLEAKQHEKAARKQASASSGMPNPDNTKMSLLDRIRLKQLLKANEPLPPTEPQLRRRAALDRVVDVAATISMLSLSSSLSLPRQAFSMAAISTKLIDSLRVPMSKEESKACVRLMATEVAPEWLKLVTIGDREHLVVQRSGQPVDRVIHERVEKLLGNVSAAQPP